MFETGDFWSNTIRIRPLGSTAEPRTIYSSDKFQADAIFRTDRIYFRTNARRAELEGDGGELRQAGVRRLD